MNFSSKQHFWIRKWALQPVRLCCRGKIAAADLGPQHKQEKQEYLSLNVKKITNRIL
jgi:hypothetical protein